MTKKSLFDRDNIELWILTPEEEADLMEVLAWDESIKEPEDVYNLPEFKQLPRWKRLYLRLKLSLIMLLESL